ncbi:hypothetical protein AB0B45_34730 [Nonomuraea sp. NPDC049152]|uniref:hypothetical protein n=1 Tax=Nonomuraea sp. NPDC049152 TaxID=3154350 RepID=UPI00340D2FBB
MCNPRRVKVRATRRIAEAWRAEIERTVTASGEATGESRLTQPLRSMLGEGALRAFEQALGGDPRWEWADGEYRMRVPGGHVAYQPGVGDLEIVISLTEAVEAVGIAGKVVEGEVTDEVEGEGEGSYDNDGWRGRTKERAEREARKQAEARADKLAAERAERLRLDAQEAASYSMNTEAGAVEDEARRRAEAALAERRLVVGQDLGQRADARLAEVHRQTLKDVMGLIAASYAQAIREFAQQNNAENYSVVDGEGFIEIQFEMEA